MKSFFIRNKSNLLIGLIIGFLFFIVNFFLISNGHFHEDAYILFIYVENFINGNGITYYPGGPPTEGATDFLWLVMLIILVKIGLSTGTAAIFLNSVGVFVISFILSNAISDLEIKNRRVVLFSSPLIFMWLFSPPLEAAVGGFSVFLYMALILMAFVSVYKKQYVLLTPYISLIIALFRPDGVILGFGFVLVGFYIAFKNSLIKKYSIGILFGLIVGVFYFIWRFNYFGNLLPLPLYVKSSGLIWSGVEANISWLRLNKYYLIPLLILAFYNKRVKHYIFLSSPIILLFLVLSIAHQSQNIGYRFQAPIFIISYYILVLLIIETFNNKSIVSYFKPVYFIYLLVLLFFGYNSIIRASTVLGFNYINQFPLALNKILPKRSTIALTEAGRIAYWNQSGKHVIIDLVGLNSEYPAKNTISVKYLEGLSPDMIMYHHVGLLNVKWLATYTENQKILTNENLEKFVGKNNYPFIDRPSLTKEVNASLISTEFLQIHFQEYDIILVDYAEDKSFSHVYAFKKSLSLRDEIESIFRSSFQREKKKSYFEMLKIK